MSERPNIILIQVDQWRADSLGFAGHPVAETPHLDGLFRQGVHFSQAYAAVPSCIAARASLHTGLTPRSHGRVGYQDGVPWDYEVTLAGLLARNLDLDELSVPAHNRLSGASILANHDRIGGRGRRLGWTRSRRPLPKLVSPTALKP